MMGVRRMARTTLSNCDGVPPGPLPAQDAMTLAHSQARKGGIRGWAQYVDAELNQVLSLLGPNFE